MHAHNTRVFVSYSRHDESLVAPVVSLLRASKALVFHDVDSIEPGRRWREEIEAAIEASEMVVVFWCRHASESAWMAKEWALAIEGDKQLLPLLLDATALPPPLRAYQYLDFRDVVGSDHGIAPAPASEPAPRSSRNGLRGAARVIGVLAVALLALVVGSLAWGLLTAEPALLAPLGYAGLAAAAVLGLLLFASVRRREKRRRLRKMSSQYLSPELVERLIASGADVHAIAERLTQEIVRRTPAVGG